MTDQLFDKRWQMNPTASSFSTDFAPAIETRLYEAVEGGYKLTVPQCLGMTTPFGPTVIARSGPTRWS